MYIPFNKRWRKTKGQSRYDNKTLATLRLQDTERNKQRSKQHI